MKRFSENGEKSAPPKKEINILDFLSYSFVRKHVSMFPATTFLSELLALMQITMIDLLIGW